MRVLEFVGAHALHGCQRTLDRPQYLGHRDRRGGPGQLVAAFDAPAGAHDAGAPELGEDVLQEVLWDLLEPGELFPFDRPLVAPGRGRSQLDGGADCVVGLGGDPHPGILAPRGGLHSASSIPYFVHLLT